jgi:MraZ protein
LLGFFGTFQGVIDDKGRLSIPAKIRPGDVDKSKKKRIPAGEDMVLTEGLDGCLSLYPETEWEKIQARLDTLPYTQKDIRYFSRRLYQHTTLVRIDDSGRILIPEILRQVAGLQKDVLLVGVKQCIEIWDPVRYGEYHSNYGRTYEDVAENLFRNAQE